MLLKRIDGVSWLPAIAIAELGSLFFRSRPPDPKPLIIRPGGMGDLILLCMAVEELGLDPRSFLWAIERRSSGWARHLGLDHLCYDDNILTQNWKLAGRFSIIINTEQFFGLSQATAVLARARGAVLTSFDTNRGAAWAERRVLYDPDQQHEAIEFQRIIKEGMALGPTPLAGVPRRVRLEPASEKPIVGIGGLQSQTRAFSEQEWMELVRPWIGDRCFWIASSELDRPFGRRLASLFDGRAEVFEGCFDELCNLVRRSQEVFTVDGGFLHIASYYGTPSTAVFTSGRASKWKPLSLSSYLIQRGDLKCQPCAWFGQVPPCRNAFACKKLAYEKHNRPAI